MGQGIATSSCAEEFEGRATSTTVIGLAYDIGLSALLYGGSSPRLWPSSNLTNLRGVVGRGVALTSILDVT